MLPKNKSLIALITISLLIVLITRWIEKPNHHQVQTSYWLWAGVTAQAAPPDSEYYIYQGLISSTSQSTDYRRIGLYPHPLKASKIFLVYRLEGQLPEPEKIVAIFQNSVAQWQRHPLTITGLQLDFDSPTSKLLIYSDFLKKLRALLPKDYALSITGLGDWAVNDNVQAMRAIADATDEIVFQLYQGWKPLPDIDHYVNMLRQYPLPFRIGLLANNSNSQYISRLSENSHFHGVVYFIQRKL